MAIIEEEDFVAGIVQPYVSIPYMSINKIDIQEDSGTDLYTTHDYYSAMPITRVRVHTDPDVSFKGDGEAITETFMLGQYHNNPLTMIIPQTASYDLLTDILSGVYKYLCSEQPGLAYLCLQAYSLVSRMATDNVPFIGAAASEYEITPYAL